MIEKDPKKKRGLLSLPEKMGLDQTSEMNAPRAPKAGILTDEEETDSSPGETVGDKVRSRMTGRQGV